MSGSSEQTGRDVRSGSGEMFDAIAGRYDLLNRILSLGMDQGWRRRAVRALALKRGARVLDLATGTADLAIAIAEEYPDATVIGMDPSRGMLDVGRRKLGGSKLEGRIELQVGDAQELPLGDASVDGVAIAFGIRNVPDRPRALREMARVTREGGRVVILELSEPRRGLMGTLARTYVHDIVPRVGGLISGAKEYRYLQRSIQAFPPPEEFVRTMEASGLRVIESAPLTFGVAWLFVATPAREGASRKEA
ncbi:bifunctional demethylmenaquinone methyltransferase/2-methoxy-6-polyprenyl-1,4-benzoquinol methylase UbiE [Polyangium aurulentum]|uniref:bifunctional demethylmenaquinone methyltransferase/2-methoxy-6-polyprenyl-1,4-benzoquinol methylase UbiE n=1 Tax=Polyangium aurulentum TaxID=2567896 RepID=UPI0010AE02A0|nr:bifunctional demethylmenaquinone methyltransferase/2-methoxy-6-polyprenyl-1,4-benzoquinol methylase UbiE [Polyangium aurulentum]UQA57376.1 bifunctional demethylmenaquinone methyltransferase/2-methoxy-6-polyprenyl-1,4-benzoquinol methylase UbiE [Polyangium aurulentum]